MSKLIIDLEEKLKILKSGNNLLAIKAEFEAEGTRIEELSIISFLCSKYSIPLTLKIGGTCAKRDIYEAFQVGANNILVPMVESAFSLEYFINCYESFKSNFESFNNCPSISINIESIKGFENLDLIIEKINKISKKFEFIVIGRSDLASSMKINDVNSNSILDLTERIIKTSYENNIKVTIGGNLTINVTGDSAESANTINFTGTGASMVEINGAAPPNNQGAFCALPACLFTGAPHIGSQAMTNKIDIK